MRILQIATCALSCALLGCASPPPPPEIPHVPGHIHLALHSPPAEETLEATIPWLEIRGAVRAGELSGADVILALDLSNSALHASGDDVDGDGVVGENRYEIRDSDKWNRSFRTWVTDPDDSIARSELATAEMLVRALEPTGARFALITYHSRAYVKSELGPAEDTLRALEKIRLSVDKSGSRLTKSMRKAHVMLKRTRREGPNQPKPALLIFTDGLPTSLEQRHSDVMRFERLAEDLGEFETRVYVLGFGEEAPEDDRIGPVIADRTGGHHLHVTGDRRNLEVLAGPSDWDLTELAVTNLTTGESARAIRQFPDGSFDGFVKLVEGENEIQVRLLDNHGRSLSESRSVVHTPPPVASADQLSEGQEILRRLRERLREMELDPEQRRPPVRTLTVDPERTGDVDFEEETDDKTE